jgi:hypothetical protein
MAKPNFTLPNKPAIKSGSILSYNYTDDFTFVPAPLTFNRDSAATRVNEKGLIEDVGYFGPELVQNGDFEEEGSELIINGGFDTDSDWSKGAGWTIANGKATHTGGSSDSSINQFNRTVIGKNYKAVFTFSGGLNSSNHIMVYGVELYADFYEYTSDGTYTLYFTADATFFRFRAINPDNDVSIDNVSVKEVGQNWELTEGAFFTENGINITNGSAPGGINTDGYTPLVAGRKYRITYEITENNAGSIKLISAIDELMVSTVGTHTKEFIADIYPDIIIFRNGSTVDVTIDNISVVEVLGDKPRIDYSDSLTEPSLLLEPQSTNLVTYSEDFSQSVWEYSGDLSIESGYTAPDGSNTACKVTGTNSPLAANFSATSTQARSIWARTVSGTGTIQLLTHNSNTNNTFTITSQWQRFEINSTTSATGVPFFYAVDFRGASTTLSEVILWGAQLEALSYATSYIPTAGSTATRLGETANNAGDVNVFNSEEGVLYAEIAALADDGTTRYIAISDGSNNERAQIIYSSTSNRIIGSVAVGNVGQVSINFDGITTNYNKIAFSYKQNDFKMYVNGTLIGSDTSGSVPAVLDTFGFERPTGVSQFYGKIKNLQVFNKALTDKELEILTIQ